jgi:uncharacterized iron-regulated membrane protein
MVRGSIRAWSFVHKWTSLVCTAFLLMLCVTGLPLIFHDEIDALTNPPVQLVTLPAGTPLLPLDALLAVALKKHPGHVPLYMSFDEDRPVVNITTGPKPDAPGSDMAFLSLDGRTAAVLPAEPDGGFMHVMFQLHVDMFMGTPGMLFLGAMGFLFFMAILSGVVLYAPFMRRVDFGTIRTARKTRTRWLDTHNVLGVVTMMWAAVVGLTGTINTVAEPVTTYWKADQLAGLAPRKAAGTDTVRTGSVQAALDTAMAAAPGMRAQFIGFPGVAYSSRHHLAVFLQGNTPLTKKLLTPAFVDAQTGSLAALTPMPWYMKSLLLSQPLHFGDYGGMPLKIIWALLDIITMIVLGSGLWLWWSKARLASHRVFPPHNLALGA